MYNNIVRQAVPCQKKKYKRTDGAAVQHFPLRLRVKGKQVQVLYDLVTVSVEHSARYVTDAVHREGGGVQ